MTDPEIRAAVDDRLAVAGTLFGEAAGLSRLGREAVASTIRNRLLTPRRFGTTWKNVCLMRSAFSCWWKWGGNENNRRLLTLIGAALEGKPFPLSARERVVWEECLQIADEVMTGSLPDRVRASTHYFNPDAMPDHTVPAWAHGKTPAAIIKPHLFYAGIA